MYRTVIASLALGFALATSAIAAPASITDPKRPAEDVARDAARKPKDMLTFAGIKPGSKVLELLPGGGYFTRIFSKEVGASGHVYAATAPSADQPSPLAPITSDAAYANVSEVNIRQLPDMPPLDVIWTSQNYHDLHLTQVKADMKAAITQWLSKLKPGGVMVIVDHVALPGSPATETADKLHRIDPAIIRQEMEANGFVFDGESTVLRNPADPHTAGVFDPAIRGKTDQVVYRFKKPG